MTKIYETYNIYCKHCDKLVLPDLSIHEYNSIVLLCPKCNYILNYMNFDYINCLFKVKCKNNEKFYANIIIKDKDLYYLIDEKFYCTDILKYFSSTSEDVIIKQSQIKKEIIKKSLNCKNCKLHPDNVSIDEIFNIIF